LYFEETDFCYRPKKAGFATWYVPQSRVMHIAGQSTSVTDKSAGTRRLPGYWFKSRRRYFVSTFGIQYAIATDVATIISHIIGWVKVHTLGETTVPYFVRDLFKYSPIWPSNRATSSVTVSDFTSLKDERVIARFLVTQR